MQGVLLCVFLLFLWGCRLPFSKPGPTVPGPSGPTSTKPGPPEPRKIQTAQDTVRGSLCQVGNAPSFEMVINGSSTIFGYGEYRVVGAKLREIKRLPLGPIVAKGKIRRQKLSFAGSANQTRLEIEVTEYRR